MNPSPYEGLRLLVVGDVMLDIYETAEPILHSPERADPHLRIIDRRYEAGGAGLAAVIAARAGATVTLVGTRGLDDAAQILDEVLTEPGLERSLVTVPWPTTQKTRTVFDGRVVRRDFEVRGVLSDVSRNVIEARCAGAYDAVLLSDYGKGVFLREDLRGIFKDEDGRSCPVILDPKSELRFEGVDIATPNRAEAIRLTQAAGVSHASALVSRELGGATVLTTLGADGVHINAHGLTNTLKTVRAEGSTVGAGDAFAVGVALEAARGSTIRQAVLAGMAFARGMIVYGRGWTFEPSQVAAQRGLIEEVGKRCG